MMYCLDKNRIHGYCIVMGNEPIYKPAAIRKRFESRSYKCVYLLTGYSPIEVFWSKVKAGTKRNPLNSGVFLTPKIMDSITKVTMNDCHG